METRPKVALIYDFDKTLSPRNMQTFGFIDQLGVTEEDFWKMCGDFCKKNNVEQILGCMFTMINEYKKKGIEITKQTFNDFGKNIELFDGVETWFSRINEFADKNGVTVEHYIVSSGIKEMIEGTKIAKYFKEIYADYFVYDDEGHPIWPAFAVNFTNKTQYIYRINKGILDATDNSINDYMDHDVRPIPMTNMIYIGDSETDIPCMRLIKKAGGFSIGVFNDDDNGQKYLKGLLCNNRINFIAKADYEEGSDIDKIVKEIIMTVKHKDNLRLLNEKGKNS